MTRTELFHMELEEMTDLELIKNVEAFSEKQRKYVKSVYTMSIPPRVDDTDMIISELIRRFKLKDK